MGGGDDMKRSFLIFGRIYPTCAGAPRANIARNFVFFLGTRFNFPGRAGLGGGGKDVCRVRFLSRMLGGGRGLKSLACPPPPAELSSSSGTRNGFVLPPHPLSPFDEKLCIKTFHCLLAKTFFHIPQCEVVYVSVCVCEKLPYHGYFRVGFLPFCSTIPSEKS